MCEHPHLKLLIPRGWCNVRCEEGYTELLYICVLEMCSTNRGSRPYLTETDILPVQKTLKGFIRIAYCGFAKCDAPPPMTTNATTPKAQALMGLRFSSFSLRDGLTGFLPARALLANCWFFWRSSNSVGCTRIESATLEAVH